MPRCRLPLAALCTVLVGLSVVAAPNPNDGIQVLLMLCDPFGANTGLLWNNFERLGWDVTTTGRQSVVGNCNYVTTTITIDVLLNYVSDIGPFDAVAISPTPGTYLYVPSPASDLRESEKATSLIQQANAQGLTLYAGCSALLVLAEADVLEGRNVVCHSKLLTECNGTGASCLRGSFRRPPLTDGNLVTGTNQRYFALEIPEAMARSLDRLDRFEPSIDRLALVDFDPGRVDLEPSEAVTSASAFGTAESDLAYDVCSFGDGFVVVGQTYGGNQGTVDALVLCFDASGALLWARVFGGPGRDVAHSVCPTADGALAIAGLTTSAGAGSEDALLFKLTSYGDLLWARTYGGTDPDAGLGLCEAANGDLLLTGYTHGPDLTFSALRLLRVDCAGEKRWTALYDGIYYERGHSIVERPDGSLLVAGGTSSFGAGNYDMLLAAYSADGEPLWTVAYGRASYDIAEQVILTESGDAVIAGFGDLDGSDPNNAILTRVDAEGKRLWLKRNGPRLSFDYAQGVVELDSGSFLLCGAFAAEETGRNDVWLLAFSADGSKLWEQTYGWGAENEWANALCRLADGRIVSVGWTRSHGAGSHDVLVMVLDPALIP